MNSLDDARCTMEAAAEKAAGRLEDSALYLRAAIAYWRLKEEAAQDIGDVAAQLEAVTHRIGCEDDFRRVSGRSYHTVTDAISFDDVARLP